MTTVFDWVSLAIFAGLIVLFLQRSTSESAERDVSLLHYLGAGVGCAVANYLGNHGNNLLATLLIAAVVIYIILFLKPFRFTAGS
jgi:hypothetical protein